MNPAGNTAFHTGYLFVKSGLIATPRRIGTLQETSFSFKGSNKALMGENTFAEAIGRADVSISGKAKNGKFNADAFNDIFFGQAPAAGHTAVAYDEKHAIDTATIALTHEATFVEDLGVAFVLTGIQLKRVASAPITGQYTVNNAGEYGFAVADDDKEVLVSYSYQDATSGKTIEIVNQLAGEAPTFSAIFFNRFQGGTIYLKLNAVVSENLDLAFKSGDFAMPDFGFQAQADANGNVGTYSQSKA